MSLLPWRFGVLAALSSVACVIGPTSSSDAGAVDAGSQTVGDQCIAIDTEFCSQAISRCGMIGFTLADCISSNMPICCTGSVCSATSLSPPSAVAGCKNAIDVEDCNTIANNMLPAECQGVPQKP